MVLAAPPALFAPLHDRLVGLYAEPAATEPEPEPVGPDEPGYLLAAQKSVAQDSGAAQVPGGSSGSCRAAIDWLHLDAGGKLLEAVAQHDVDGVVLALDVELPRRLAQEVRVDQLRGTERPRAVLDDRDVRVRAVARGVLHW